MGGFLCLIFVNNSMPPVRADETPCTEDDWYTHSARLLLESEYALGVEYGDFLRGLPQRRISQANADRLRSLIIKRDEVEKEQGEDVLVIAPRIQCLAYNDTRLQGLEGDFINLEPITAAVLAPSCDIARCVEHDDSTPTTKVGARVQLLEDVGSLPKYAFVHVEGVDADRTAVSVRDSTGSLHEVPKTVCTVITPEHEVCVCACALPLFLTQNVKMCVRTCSCLSGAHACLRVTSL